MTRSDELVIRMCRASDDPLLEELSALEARPLPPGSFVVAELGGALVAALPLDAPAPAFADPFRPTAAIVRLLEVRANQIRSAESRPPRWSLRSLVRV